MRFVAVFIKKYQLGHIQDYILSDVFQTLSRDDDNLTNPMIDRQAGWMESY